MHHRFLPATPDEVGTTSITMRSLVATEVVQFDEHHPGVAQAHY